MPALGHVDDLLAVEGVDSLAEGGAGLLRAEAVLVVAMALWRFLDGWHGHLLSLIAVGFLNHLLSVLLEWFDVDPWAKVDNLSLGLRRFGWRLGVQTRSVERLRHFIAFPGFVRYDCVNILVIPDIQKA